MVSKRKAKKIVTKPVVAKKQKPVKEMSVKELLLSSEFRANVQKLVSELQNERKFKNGLVNTSPKRHPIDYLNLDVNYLITEYSAILNKKSQLSSNSREFIKAVCEHSARKTIKQLQENETAREVRHGDN